MVDGCFHFGWHSLCEDLHAQELREMSGSDLACCGMRHLVLTLGWRLVLPGHQGRVVAVPHASLRWPRFPSLET